ncbi:hypothetical protein HBN50_10130 [Halobacteriovorax sp. GB3]|uniref:hypothetical protein n=1 Tax=Halobacteriovorax sp. GB3 TaxID=2719615 RepID=UPI00235FD3A3|nr:hypothetical protein [Halobacteriovorax sp. GB3]MDD0853458.1 hypothetical protein [Halobacteriovorax sp. GB3]
MKLLIAALVALSSQAFAVEFKATSTLYTQSEYSLVTTLNIQILGVDPALKLAAVEVNGIQKEVKLEVLKTETRGVALYTEYKAYVKEDLISNGASCDEFEEVNYIVEFSSQKSPMNSLPALNNILSVKAQSVYLYDICHDTKPQVNTVYYVKK